MALRAQGLAERGQGSMESSIALHLEAAASLEAVCKRTRGSELYTHANMERIILLAECVCAGKHACIRQQACVHSPASMRAT